jgi:hypothetical protein
LYLARIISHDEAQVVCTVEAVQLVPILSIQAAEDRVWSQWTDILFVAIYGLTQIGQSRIQVHIFRRVEPNVQSDVLGNAVLERPGKDTAPQEVSSKAVTAQQEPIQGAFEGFPEVPNNLREGPIPDGPVRAAPHSADVFEHFGKVIETQGASRKAG